jgi:hypothetical protein
MQTKDNRISCLDGQLSKLRGSFEAESTKVSKLTAELERSIISSNKNRELLEQKEQGMKRKESSIYLSGMVKNL